MAEVLPSRILTSTFNIGFRLRVNSGNILNFRMDSPVA